MSGSGAASEKKDPAAGEGKDGKKEEELYENRGTHVVIRVITVMAYLFSVSFAGMVLSGYYLFLWHPPSPREMHARARELHSEPRLGHLVAPRDRSSLETRSEPSRGSSADRPRQSRFALEPRQPPSTDPSSNLVPPLAQAQPKELPTPTTTTTTNGSLIWQILTSPPPPPPAPSTDDEQQQQQRRAQHRQARQPAPEHYRGGPRPPQEIASVD